jgi:hypothetical protein
VDRPQTPDLGTEQGIAADIWPPAAPLAFISEYTSNLLFVPGTSNAVADALYRPFSGIATTSAAARLCTSIANRAPFDLKDLALRQILCPQVQTLRSKPGLQIVTQRVGDLDLIDDAATGTFCPLVPRDLGRQVFKQLHGAAHPGRMPPAISLPPGTYGKVCPQTSLPWRENVCTASGPKYTAMSRYLHSKCRCQLASSANSTCTLWGPLHIKRFLYLPAYYHGQNILLAGSYTQRRHHNS